MLQYRQTDTKTEPLPARHERFFKKDRYWYYTTREGVNIGPFDSLDDAREGCTDFLDFITGAGRNYIPTLRAYAMRAV